MILAPMAGVTDAAFRHVCIDYGCKRAFCEMVSVNALNYKSKRTYELLNKADNEDALYVQLFGGEPYIMGEAAKMLKDKLGDMLGCIDINMGCPMPKITKSGYGSALLKDEVRAGEIVSAVKKAYQGEVGVKMRIGFKGRDINPVAFAKAMEGSGADVISVHGRTADQLYSGRADRQTIKAVKEAVGVRVVGNGDIFTYADAVGMVEQTGCDDVLIARGAMGNPFIFAGRDDVGITEKVDTALKHLELCAKYKPEPFAVLQMRKHIAWYIKNSRGSSGVRCEINGAKTKEQVRDILLKYKETAEKTDIS